MIKVKTNPMKYKDSNGNMIDVGGVIGKEVTDLTLTKSNVPADSKTVGDKLNKLSQEKVDHDELNEAILNVQTEDLQFVDTVAEMTDSKRNYVLKETGEIWSCQKVTKSFTNQIPISTDADGNIFDGDGYKTDAYMSSSGSDSARTGCVASGFIPYTADKSLYYKGVDLITDNDYTRMLFYDSSKTAHGYCVKDSDLVVGHKNSLNTYFDITQVNDYYKMTPTEALKTTYSNLAFIRVSAGLGITGDEWIMTVDEPIEEFTGHEFTPTGRYYGTESLQIVTSEDEMTDTSKKYVLEETGTIWYYGEISGEEEVSYINRAEPLPNNTTDISKWVNGYRFSGSSGAPSTQEGTTISNHIACKGGDVIRIKGVTLRENIDRVAIQTKANVGTEEDYSRGYFNVGITFGTDTPVVYNGLENGVYTFTLSNWGGNEISSFRFTMPTPTAEDANKIIVTVNEEIVEGGTSKPSYTNQIPLSTDADGNVVGLIKDHRYGSSDTLSAVDGVDSIGYIPVKFGDTIRFKNIMFNPSMDYNGSIYIRVYDANYTLLTATSPLQMNNELSRCGDSEVDADNNLISVILNNANVVKNVAFLRMSFIPINENPIITVNEEIVDSDSDDSNTGVLAWKDSKIKYAGTGDEDSLIEVERRVTKAEGNIKRLENRIDNIKVSDNSSTTEAVEGIPEYWKTAVDSMRDTILAQLDEGGHESFGFTWGADIHGKNGYTNPSNGAGTSVTKNIGHVCQYATEVYDLPFAMFSGDIMSQGSHSKEETVHTEHEDMMEIFSPINFYKLLIEKGNHDGAYGAPVDGVYYLYNIGGKELYNNLFRKQALDRTRVFGGDGSYFYVDTPNNMRVIMLNGHTTGDDSVDENGYAVYNSMKYGVYGNEQLEWLANEALNTNKRIIVSAHQPLTQSMDGSILAGILNAYNNRTSYKGSKDVTAEYWGNGVSDNTYTMISIEKDFASAKGKVIAYFHGHIHKDTIDNTTNTFIVASITTAGADVRDANPVKRVAGTATETALDIVIITDKKIYFNRLGAGVSREVAIK